MDSAVIRCMSFQFKHQASQYKQRTPTWRSQVRIASKEYITLDGRERVPSPNLPDEKEKKIYLEPQEVASRSLQ